MAVKASSLGGPKPQFEDANGAPISGGKLYFFAAGSSTPQNTYTDSTGATPNAHPIVLNSRGEPPNEIWFTVGLSYKGVLKDATDVTIWTVDNITGINDTSGVVEEWQASGLTPTFVGVSSFSFAGDQTTEYTVGRRLQFTTSGGTVYGRITASSFAASITTVTMQMDGAQVLDSGLSAVNKSILRSSVKSNPERIATSSGTDTYTATVGISRLVIGDEFKVKIASTNTSTTPTLNLDSLGAKTIVRPDGSALIAGDLNGEHTFRWNGTNQIVLNPARQNASETISGVVELATQAEVNAMTDTTRAITPNHNKIVLGTEQASTAGTSIDFTGIPAGVRRITITLVGVSTNGTSVPIVQLGDSGGIETAGYSGSVANVVDAAATVAGNMSVGFSFTAAMAATVVLHGHAVLTLEDSTDNTWSFSNVMGRSDAAVVHLSGGTKALSATLDRIRITTVGGVDTFDAGVINISYER